MLYSCKQQTKPRRQGWPTLYVSMPGKRLSLVCCCGPAAFHFPGWICCESFGGGEVCTFFKYCMYGKTGLIFKPDTIMINHQLEFSWTRVKYLDHEKRAYKHDIRSNRISEKHLIIAHSGVSRETRCLNLFGVFFNFSYFITCASCIFCS